MFHKRTVIGGPVAAIGLAVGLVLTTASPALAATGSGSGGTGHLALSATNVNPDPPCAEITSFSYSGAVSGTYAVGGNTFSGTVNLTMSLAPESGHHYYEGPEGTYGEDSTCSTLNPWPVTGTTLGSGTGTVACYNFSGTYSRTNFLDMVQELDGDCVVSGSSSSPTHEHREATIDEESCDENLPPDACNTVDDEYTATNN